MTSITIGKDEFIEFLRALTALKDICTDITIEKGMIRQRIDSRESFFQMDLRHILGDCSIPISHLKLKLDLLKTFFSEEVILSINDDNTFYSFEDAVSRYSFKWTDTKMMSENSRYINDDELGKLIGKYEDIILETTIDKKVSDRIKLASQLFSVRNVTLEFSERFAKLKSEHQNKEQNAIFMKDIVSLLDGDAFITLSIIPLTVDHDGPMTFEVAAQKINNKIQVLQTVDMKMNNTEITFYGASILKTDED
jgi:hypothetical protein